MINLVDVLSKFAYLGAFRCVNYLNLKSVLSVLACIALCSSCKLLILNDVLSVLRFRAKALSRARARATGFSIKSTVYHFCKKLKHLRTLRTLATALFIKNFFVLANYFYLEHLEQSKCGVCYE